MTSTKSNITEDEHMNKEFRRNKDAIIALSKIQSEARRNGISNMTLDEINAEIIASRKERKKPNS